MEHILNDKILGRSLIPGDTVTKVEYLLRQGKSYNEINKHVRYHTKNGKLRHISLGKISEIKNCLSKKEGAVSG